MALITHETITNIKNCDELMDFIALNRYKTENAHIINKDYFLTLPEYSQHIILILDFETEYEMGGLFTIFQNSIGNYLFEIANSFEKTQNFEIANCLKNSLAVLASFDFTPHTIKQKLINAENQYIIQENRYNNEKLIEEINLIDIKLRPLILKKYFWNRVSCFVNHCLTKQN